MGKDMRHIGEYNRNSKGDEYVVCDFEDADHVYVIFSDGTKAGPVKYDSVKRGILRKPRASVTNSRLDVEGKTVKLADGTTATCEIYRNDNDICVVLSNGMIVDHVTVKEFESGSIQIDNGNIMFMEERQHASKANRVRDERIRTFNNTLFLLRRYHVCAVIRPCGFGKTYLFKRLARQPEYRKILYVYPHADAEGLLSVGESREYDSKHKKRFGKIDIMTYAALSRKSDKALEKMDYDLVFFDEMHFIGAGKIESDTEKGGKGVHTYPAVKKFMEMHPRAHFCGATATPDRTDGVRIVERLFHGITTYPYSEEDAFEDGLYTAPKYVYCTYGIERMVRNIQNEMKKKKMEVTREEIKKIAGTEKLERVNAENMDKVIRRVCDETLDDTSYMRFICFYPTIKELQENREKCETWFRKAYPDHQVYSLEVHSRSEADINAVRALPKESGRIDLVMNCEILNTGYHDEYLTGLVLDRKTQSWTKYMQMVGRIFSMSSDKKTIIFDIGDNIHSDFVYGTDPEDAALAETAGTNISLPETSAPVVLPDSYSGIRAAFPHAANWWKIRLEEKAVKESNMQTVTAANGTTPGNDVKQENCGKAVTVENTEHSKPADPAPAAIYHKATGNTQAGIPKSKHCHPHKISGAVTPEKVTIPIPEAPDWEKICSEIGYDPRRAMRPARDGSWLRNHVDVFSNDVDEQTIRDKLIREKIEPLCRNAVAQFDSLLPDRKFLSYADAENPARGNDIKVLKACAWVQGIQWETVLRYMVETEIMPA